MVQRIMASFPLLAVIGSLVLVLGQTALAQEQQGNKPIDVASEIQLLSTAFTYQGELKDTTGLVNGLFDIRFTLFEEQTGGDRLDSIVYDNVGITNGWFTLKVDFGYDVNGRWLEIAVRPVGSESLSMFSPRQKLTTEPHAVFARHEQWSLVGMPVGVMDPEHGDIDLPSEAPPGRGVVLSLTAAGEPDALTGDLILAAGGSTGIGSNGVDTITITTPTALPPSGPAGGGLSGTYPNPSLAADGYADTYVNVSGDTMTGNLNLPSNGLKVGTDELVVSGGRVGIGTTSPDPSARLHVDGGSGPTGVYGSGSSTGVLGKTISGTGISGYSSNGKGVYGSSSYGTGVHGESSSGYAGYFDGKVYVGGPLAMTGALDLPPNGLTVGTDQLVVSGGNVGIGTTSPGYKLHVDGGSSHGVFGESTTHYGVYGKSTAPSTAGVYGENSIAIGVYGIGSTGVRGYSGSGVGVHGSGSTGVYGGGDSRGVHGQSPGGTGVYGLSSSGTGVYGSSSSGWAGHFHGNVWITGNLSKGGGSFKIDHPLDPANKYLYHSFVESPDMMNVYNGNLILDASGEAVVTLPDWFEALNKEFRYQLTAIGAPAPNLYIAEEISNNRFLIAGGYPGMKVSWQVTGVRHDPYANQHRIPVEENKPEAERGYYLHPAVYGEPEEKGIEWARHPELMRQMKAEREKLKEPSRDSE